MAHAKNDEPSGSTQPAFQGIIPMLVCKDAAAEIEFCRLAFHAVEVSRRTGDDNAVLHALLRIGTALIMVHGETSHLASRAPEPDGTSSVVLYLYLEDVDAAVARAVAAGAQIVLPAEDQFWGDRVARVLDTASHVWNIAGRTRHDG